MTKYLDKIANVAVILGVTAFLILVVRGELARTRRPDPSGKALLGSTVKLPGVRFPQQRKSLVLAISTTCHFCEQSLPFYRELAEKAQGKLEVVAVLPQSQQEAQAYIQQAAVSATKVVSASLDTIGVSGTPTLLLVDGKGRVEGVWVGLLSEQAQHQVLSRALGI